MEGLIPLVYKAIQKNRTRSRYECLSSGSALPFNPADFRIADSADGFHQASIGKSNSAGKFHRRSYSSVQDFSAKDRRWDAAAGSGGGAVTPGRNKQLKRFSSHRMFSCVSGY